MHVPRFEPFVESLIPVVEPISSSFPSSRLRLKKSVEIEPCVHLLRKAHASAAPQALPKSPGTEGENEAQKEQLPVEDVHPSSYGKVPLGLE